MIFDISDLAFRNIMNDEKLALPKRWDGSDFYAELKSLFDYYKKKLHTTANSFETISVNENKINKVCEYILKSINYYFEGFPEKAYQKFKSAMEKFMSTQLIIYPKSIFDQFEAEQFSRGDKLNLFRAVKVNENVPYDRNRVFHTPYTLRSKVSTNRYSIAGFPSLYLGTSLQLCCEEIDLDIHKNFAIAARFQLERYIEHADTNISIIELGIKPQDFLEQNEQWGEIRNRRVPPYLLNNSDVKSAYLLWYPLIAACSFIRINKADPFAAEYIIPQLLMQWVRNKMASVKTKGKNNDYTQLIGIRYFSCASMRSSDLGFNYVFPTSGQKNVIDPRFCEVLSKAFKLTAPTFIHEYCDINACEKALMDRTELEHIV